LRALGFKDVPIHSTSPQLTKSVPESEMNSPISTVMEPTAANIDKTDVIDKHTDYNTSPHIVKNLAYKAAPKLLQTTNTPYEAIDTLNSQHHIMTPILHFPNFNKGFYPPNGTRSGAQKLGSEFSNFSTTEVDTGSHQNSADYHTGKNINKLSADGQPKSNSTGERHTEFVNTAYRNDPTNINSLKQAPTHRMSIEKSLFGLEATSFDIPFSRADNLSQLHEEKQERIDPKDEMLEALLWDHEDKNSKMPSLPRNEHFPQIQESLDDNTTSNPRPLGRNDLSQKIRPPVFSESFLNSIYSINSPSYQLRNDEYIGLEKQSDFTAATIQSPVGGNSTFSQGQWSCEVSNKPKDSLKREFALDKPSDATNPYSPKSNIQSTTNLDSLPEGQMRAETTILTSSVTRNTSSESQPATLPPAVEGENEHSLPATGPYGVSPEVQAHDMVYSEAEANRMTNVQSSFASIQSSTKNSEKDISVKSISNSDPFGPESRLNHPNQEPPILEGNYKIEFRDRDPVASSLPQNEVRTNVHGWPTARLLITANSTEKQQEIGSNKGGMLERPMVATMKTADQTLSESDPIVSSTKRKASEISRTTPDISNGPQKDSTLPASRSSEGSEQQLSAAQTRLALAEKRRLELAAELEFAQSKKVGKSFAIA
jgi:hypothetical protein